MKRAVSTIFLFLLTAALLTWAEDIKLTPATIVPGAAGTMNVEHDSNGNTVLTVHVTHLAKPTSLTPPKSAYVVWIQPEGKAAEPFGMLQVGNDLKGEVKGTTPYKRFTVLITAEDSPRPTEPSGPEVMHGMVTE